MKIFNFRNLRRRGHLWDSILTADVDVTSGHWFWRKTVTRQVYVRPCAAWRFSDTGALTPGIAVEELYWDFKEKQEQA